MTRPRPHGTRRKAREAALKVLYECEARRAQAVDEIPDLTAALVQLPYALTLVRECLNRRREIDARIEPALKNWKIKRLAAIERNILRISVCESFHLPGIPRAVALAEAVKLAQRFGDAKSGAFVNGVLDAIASQKEKQPGRSPRPDGEA